MAQPLAVVQSLYSMNIFLWRAVPINISLTQEHLHFNAIFFDTTRQLGGFPLS